MRTTQTQQDGITLLITLLVMGVLLSISASIMNITLKQYQLAGLAYASEVAFQAATAGMECALNHEHNYGDDGEGFDINESGQDISCFDQVEQDVDPTAVPGVTQHYNFQFDWGDPQVCSDVSVYKFYDADDTISLEINGRNMNIDRNGDNVINSSDYCPAGSVCTVVQSRGYNVPCSVINSGNRVVEREYTQVY